LIKDEEQIVWCFDRDKEKMELKEIKKKGNLEE
jgi:hypothetical protein